MRDDNIPALGPGPVPWYEDEWPKECAVCDWCGKFLYEGDSAYVAPNPFGLRTTDYFCSDDCLGNVELEPGEEKPEWRKLTYSDMTIWGGA